VVGGRTDTITALVKHRRTLLENYNRNCASFRLNAPRVGEGGLIKSRRKWRVEEQYEGDSE
jgi:hypothetical protein